MVKTVKKFLYTSLLLWMFAATPSAIFADSLSDRIGDVAASTNETSLISNIVNLALPIGTISLIGLCAYAGFVMVSSQGNPEKLNEAREIITNAILGFGLIALSVAILLIIQSVLQIPGVTPNP